MAQMTVRNIDDDVVERLRERARINRRSVESEVRSILSNAMKPDRKRFMAFAASVRARLAEKQAHSDVVADIRADRDR